MKINLIKLSLILFAILYADYGFARGKNIAKNPSNVGLTELAKDHPELLVNCISQRIQLMRFPKSYVKIWNKVDVTGESSLLLKAKTLLKDYQDGRWIFHYRTYTNKEPLLSILKEDKYRTDMDTIRLLDDLRKVFDTRFSSDLYGYVPLKKESDRPDLWWDDKPYKQKSSKPGSLYARSRFILLKVLEELNRVEKETGEDWRKNLSPEEIRLLVRSVQYYILNQSIDPIKESTSIAKKAGTIVIGVGALAALVKLGPLFGPLSHSIGLACEYFEHGVTHYSVHVAGHLAEHSLEAATR